MAVTVRLVTPSIRNLDAVSLKITANLATPRAITKETIGNQMLARLAPVMMTGMFNASKEVAHWKSAHLSMNARLSSQERMNVVQLSSA